jgi:NADH-quinone oxidoreductase subunit L
MRSIESAFAFGGDLGGFAFWALIIAAVFTSFYSWRLMFLTFFGEARGNKHTHDHAHESPMTMLVPLGVLAVGAVFAGSSGTTASSARPTRWRSSSASNTWTRWPRAAMATTRPMARRLRRYPWRGDRRRRPWRGGCGRPRLRPPLRVHQPAGRGRDPCAPDNDVLNEAHYVPLWVKFSPFVAMILGFVTAYWFYILNPSIPGRLAANQRPLYLPAEQVVFRRDLRFPLRAARAVAGPVPVEGRRRVGHRRRDQRARHGDHPLLHPLAGRAQSGYIFTTPSRWCSGSWS